MTADEIHDQNMKEFAEALGECAKACEKPELGFYSGVVWQWENELLPMYYEADGNGGDYDDYDRELNELLDGLFEQVKTGAALLDEAPALLKACEMLLRAWDEGEKTQEVEWECLTEAVAMAREAVVNAKGIETPSA
jgi:hypothetical protein